MKPMRPADGPVRQEAAVLVALVDLEGEPGLLFTRRSPRLATHRGEVSFPGGKGEPGDGGLVDTALRETEEELGIPRAAVEVWGWMPALASNSRGDYRATPVIGHIPSYSTSMVRPSEAEVAEVFTVPLARLADPALHGATQFRGRDGGKGYCLPVYTGGRHVVWGLTAIITCQVPGHGVVLHPSPAPAGPPAPRQLQTQGLLPGPRTVMTGGGIHCEIYYRQNEMVFKFSSEKLL
jgi:nudix motif 8